MNLAQHLRTIGRETPVTVKRSQLSDAAQQAIASGGKLDPATEVGREVLNHFKSSPVTLPLFHELSEKTASTLSAHGRRLEALEKALAFAQAEAAKAFALDEDADAPSLAKLERMHAAKQKDASPDKRRVT